MFSDTCRLDDLIWGLSLLVGVGDALLWDDADARAVSSLALCD